LARRGESGQGVESFSQTASLHSLPSGNASRISAPGEDILIFSGQKTLYKRPGTTDKDRTLSILDSRPSQSIAFDRGENVFATLTLVPEYLFSPHGNHSTSYLMEQEIRCKL
jgi:hypothetical protein